MAATDVFRPSDGPIYMKGNLSDGMGSDVFDSQKYVPMKQSLSQMSRPGTNRSRFGGRSMSSFFARHNPHTKRVTHLKGLLDVPICSVSDDMHLSNPRYSMRFPPDNFNNIKVHNYSRYYNLPAGAINVNSQNYPINTITGLQYFLGKPLNFRVTGGSVKQRNGLTEVPPVWRDELKLLMNECGLQPPKQDPMAPGVQAGARTPLTGAPRTQYSETTGRLIPPPSRAMSRGFSRGSQSRGPVTTGALLTAGPLSEAQEHEDMVLGLLCQILQTDDVSAVQSWLVHAGERERQLVQDLIRAAMAGQEEYYTRHGPAPPPEHAAQVRELVEKRERERPVTGVIGDESDVTKRIDRLSLEPPSARPHTAQGPLLPPIADAEEPTYRLPTSDAFRAPVSRQSARVATPARLDTPARLKYTSGGRASEAGDDTWKQDTSTVQQQN